MNLVGKNIILRAIEFEDLEFIRSLINDPDLEKSIVGWALPLSRKDEENWYAKFSNTNTSMKFVIELNGEAVGLTGIASIDWKNRSFKTAGIRIKKDVQSKGLATDTYMTLLKFAFYELGLHRGNASAFDFNKPSLRFMEKCGYVQEGVQQEAIFKNGKYNNLVTLGILEQNFRICAKEKGYIE